jgi:hypothetical protein
MPGTRGSSNRLQLSYLGESGATKHSRGVCILSVGRRTRCADLTSRSGVDHDCCCCFLVYWRMFTLLQSSKDCRDDLLHFWFYWVVGLRLRSGELQNNPVAIFTIVWFTKISTLSFAILGGYNAISAISYNKKAILRLIIRGGHRQLDTALL